MRNRREEILMAALELAAEKGLGNVSLHMIANKVGIKKPSLYNHFASKEELVEAMYEFLREQAKANANIPAVDYSALFAGKTALEILQQVVERVEIDPDANPKKGDAIVKRVRFKCPVSFYRTLPEEAYDVLGINEFNRLETTEYTPDGNSRVGGNHDKTVVLLSKREVESKNIRVEPYLEDMDISE